MPDKIIKPTNVSIKIDSLSFWWSEYNLESFYWDDLSIRFKDRNEKYHEHSTTIITKGYIKVLEEMSHDSDYGKEQLREECLHRNKNLEELLNAKDIFFSYNYDDPNDPNFYEVKFKAPKNAQGFKPSYISIFHPAEKLSLEIVKESVSSYCRNFHNILFSNIHIKNAPKKSYVLREFKKHEKEMKELEDFRKKGGKMKVQMAPGFLQDIFSEEEISRVGGIKNIEYGFIKNNNYFVRLKDGTEKIIGQPNLTLVKK